METNFNKLNFFEASVVGVILLGISLIGFEIFVSLPKEQQQKVVLSFNIFDLSKPVSVQFNQYKELTATSLEFYDQFNLAFNHLFAVDEEFQTFKIKTTQATDNFLALFTPLEPYVDKFAFSPAGRILGASTTNNQFEQTDAELSESAASIKQDNSSVPGLSVEKVNNYLQNLYLNFNN